MRERLVPSALLCRRGGTRFCNDQKKMMIMPTVRAMINAASSMPIERELM
jgi:hypothetical protein